MGNLADPATNASPRCGSSSSESSGTYILYFLRAAQVTDTCICPERSSATRNAVKATAFCEDKKAIVLVSCPDSDGVGKFVHRGLISGYIHITGLNRASTGNRDRTATKMSEDVLFSSFSSSKS